jgi:uncharacterized protein (DUF983 family)
MNRCVGDSDAPRGGIDGGTSVAADAPFSQSWKRAMANEEMESHGFELASGRQAIRLFSRALGLRCPNCGRGPVLENWLKLRVRCGNCGMRLERGEHDYFVGSLMLNFIICGLLLLVTLGVVLITTWPSVPWDLLEYGGPIAMLIVPFVVFPFSKLLWLAADIMLRPVTPDELEWHRTATTEWSTEREPPRDP